MTVLIQRCVIENIIANALDCDSSILLFGNSTSNLNSSLLIISNILLDCTSDERIRLYK